MNTKQIIKKILPKKVYNLKHLFFAWRGAKQYDNPSEELMLIGITGTSGKSSTAYFLRQILEQAGYRVGSLSTIDFYVAGECKLNDQKMTMLGRSQIQKYLREMVDKKCDIAIVETTSEGFVQYRHCFINYDMIMLTNLYPEHIDSHGSFENYKAAKLGIFEYVSKCKRKKLPNTKLKALEAACCDDIEKSAIVNATSEYASEFLQYNFERKYSFGDDIQNILSDEKGLHFEIAGKKFDAPLYGEHNIFNIAAALTAAYALGISLSDAQVAVANLKGPEGRLETVSEAEVYGFQVIVDYAFEPVAMQKLYAVVEKIQPKRIIHVFGSTGGGRDKARRFILGEYIGTRADICIVTDEDPYDDEPMEIIRDVAGAVEKTGKENGKNLFQILDRKQAIEKAVALSEPGDLLLVTGKGSEQKMVVKNNVMIPWDDRKIVREAIAKMKMK
jgi:UDP-N-acetylmuramoyl-L-alanyl-D-glutamate--2,6-diaminopimelate ligase